MEFLEREKEIYEYKKTIESLKQHSESRPILSQEVHRLEMKLDALKSSVYQDLTPAERVQISRHPKRPKALNYIANITTDFFELCGDRCAKDDQALVGGLAMIHSEKCVVIAQEKGSDTESRIRHNFGMMSPEGYRKALRLMKMAERFQLPVLSLIDTPGAHPGLEAEKKGQGCAIAHNLLEMAQLKTPIISIVIGEGCSGGALGIGLCDSVAMLEHSYYTVITPEGCASILWKDAKKHPEAAQALQFTSEHLLTLGIIDQVIDEPLGGAHHRPEIAYQGVKEFFLEQIAILKHLPQDLLIENRYLKFREIGAYQE